MTGSLNTLNSPSSLDTILYRFDTVGLDELNDTAPMLRRKDRKYLLEVDDLVAVVAGLGGNARVLDASPGGWSHYRSTYFDTAGFDLYHLAARRRPFRCKVRHRSYVDSGLDMVEVKTKDRRNQTVKHRREADRSPAPILAGARTMASMIEQSAPYAATLQPTLTTSYRRATLLMPGGAGRATIDLDSVAVDARGRRTGVGDLAIVETKSSGKPSLLDRMLWRAGHRPVKYSKYCTAMAALDSSLPANRWHRVLQHHDTSAELER